MRLLEIHRRQKCRAGDRFLYIPIRGPTLHHVYMLDGQTDSRGVMELLDNSRYL